MSTHADASAHLHRYFFHRLFQMISARAINALHHIDWVYKHTNNCKIESASRAACYSVVDKVGDMLFLLSLV